MVDNAGLGPAYAYGSPDIPPNKTAACSSSRRVPTKPRLLAALRLTLLFLAARANPVAVIIVVARRLATRPARARALARLARLAAYLLLTYSDRLST